MNVLTALGWVRVTTLVVLLVCLAMNIHIARLQRTTTRVQIETIGNLQKVIQYQHQTIDAQAEQINALQKIISIYVERNAFGRWIITNPKGEAWSGSRWVPHTNGIPAGEAQVANFGSAGEALEYAKKIDPR